MGYQSACTIALSIRTTSIPLFLAPAFANLTCCSNNLPARSFSSSSSRPKRHRGDANKLRGVSAIRSTGFNAPLSVDNLYRDLPKPRAPSRVAKYARTIFKSNPNHGLYGFFAKVDNQYKAILSQDDEEQFGRAWTVPELTFKSFEDLHVLHWKCLIEGNKATTRFTEFNQSRMGYGRDAIRKRIACLRSTMKNIRMVLLQRQTAWEELQIKSQQVGWSALGQQMTAIEEQQQEEKEARDQAMRDEGRFVDLT